MKILKDLSWVATIYYVFAILSLGRPVTATWAKQRNQTDEADWKGVSPLWDAIDNRPSDWPPVFNPWGDLEASVPMASFKVPRDFYDFTAKNIAESGVHEWYSEWTTQTRNSSEWQQQGEWQAFTREFTEENNWICTQSNPGCSDLGLSNLKRTYPNHPYFVRRVHFQIHMYQLWHDFVHTSADAIYKAGDWAQGHIEEIMTTVQLQPDPSAIGKCKFYHQVIDDVVSFAIAIGSAATEGLVGPLLQAGLPQVSQWMNRIDSKLHRKIKQEWSINNKKQWKKQLEQLRNGELKGSEAFWTQYLDNNNPVRLNPWVTVYQQINQKLYNYDGYKNLIYEATGRDTWAHGVDGGKDMDPMCASFMGGLQLDTATNVKNMQTNLRDKIRDASEILTTAFEDFYNGNTTVVDSNVSATAYTFSNQKWEGVKSITADMKEGGKWAKNMQLQISMKIASIGAAMDYSYIECTRDPKAGEISAKAATEPPCKKHKNCLRGVFFPQPYSDPTLICAAKKWYYARGDGPAKGGGYETDLPSLEKWEGFMGGQFNLTRQKVLQSSWEHFTKYDDQNDDSDLEYGSSSEERTRLAGGFHLPICFRPDINIFSGKFPAICGPDWHDLYTAEFMDAINMGNSSQLYNDEEDKWPNALILNQIPSVIDERTDSPLERYIGHCAAKIRFPDKRVDKLSNHMGSRDRLYRFHPGEDSSCDLVKERTANMTRVQAAEWFCSKEGAEDHRVFEHEYDDAVKLSDFVYHDNHRKRCKGWMKKHKHDQVVKEDPELGNSTIVEMKGGGFALDPDAAHAMIQSFMEGNWTAEFNRTLRIGKNQAKLTDEQEESYQELLDQLDDLEPDS